MRIGSLRPPLDERNLPAKVLQRDAPRASRGHLGEEAGNDDGHAERAVVLHGQHLGRHLAHAVGRHGLHRRCLWDGAGQLAPRLPVLGTTARNDNPHALPLLPHFHSHGLQEVERAHDVDPHRQLWARVGHAVNCLRCEVVHCARPHGPDDLAHPRGVLDIPVHNVNPVQHTGQVAQLRAEAAEAVDLQVI